MSAKPRWHGVGMRYAIFAAALKIRYSACWPIPSGQERASGYPAPDEGNDGCPASRRRIAYFPIFMPLAFGGRNNLTVRIA